MTGKPHKKNRYGRERTLSTAVVGLNFRMSPALQEEVAERTPLLVSLVREPKNDHDPNAIMVVLDELRPGMHIGYLTRGVAEKMAPVIDSGDVRILASTLTELDGHGSGEVFISFARKKISL